MPVAGVLFGAAFMVAVSVALGSLLVRALGVRLYRGEAALLEFLTGSACLSLATFFLCLVHQARPTVFLAAGIGAIGCAAWLRPRFPKTLPPGPRIWQAIFWAVFGAFFLVYFFNSMAPEVSPDGSGYHLGNVARFFRLGGFDWAHYSMYSFLSQGMEMLFLVAFSFGRHSAAAMVHFSFQASVPLLLACYGRRFGFPRIGYFAAILFYASPVVGIDGISAYNDVTLAAVLLGVFYLLQVWDENQHPNTLILIGLLSGFAYGIKYTAALASVFAVAYVLVRSRSVRPALVTALIAGLLIAPWVLRDWIWVGNPVAPFLNRWFSNPYFTPGMEKEYLSGLAEYPPIQHRWQIPVQLTVLGGLVPGMTGPVFLLAPLALLGLRHPHGRRALLAAAVFGLPAFFNTDTRFLIPALPFVALAMGLGMANSWGVLPALAVFQAVVCWPGVLSLYCDPNAWRLRRMEVAAALRREPEDAFIARHIAVYALRERIDELVPPGNRIFSFSVAVEAYIDRELVIGSESAEANVLQNRLFAAVDHPPASAATQALKAHGIGYLLVADSDAVAPSMRADPARWGVTEMAEANGIHLYHIQ
jgi:hypothetical protein